MTPKRIVITGATGGLGRALVRAYAGTAVHFLLFGRDDARLEAARLDAEAAGARAEAVAINVTENDAMGAAIRRFSKDAGVDLVLLAAGVKVGNAGGIEPTDQMERVLAVNLTATIHQVQAVLPFMKDQGHGQIALFSSLAALSPHADLLSYSASKAAVRAYAGALRRCLRGTGVTVHTITPGFVDTPMTDRHHGPTPFLVPADRAARIIRLSLSKGRARVSFPLILVLLVRLQNLLPVALGDFIDRRFRAHIEPDRDEQISQAKAKTD
ncbi:MAG: SDR family NAD(P)-dependent oxidoreductase [Boseongicola sp.]